MTGRWPDDPGGGAPDQRSQATRRVDPAARPGSQTSGRAPGAPVSAQPTAPARTGRPRIGGLRLTPTRVTLVVALVGSVAFVFYALTVRDASQIPLLAAGALVLGIVFSVLAVAGLVGTYAAARDGRSAAALWQALAGGVAALVAFGCFALAALLVLLLRSPAGG